MTGFRQHLNWTTKMCDHVIRLSNSGWTVQTLIRSHVRSSLIQALFWLWKIYSSCWDNDVTRNVCLNVFERVCILNEDEIQITSSSRHQEIAKIASHKSKRLHVQPKLDKCHGHKLMFNKASLNGLSDLQPFFKDMITWRLKCAMNCVEKLTQSTQKAETQGNSAERT